MNAQPVKRAVPHINHTPGLDAAVTAALNAKIDGVPVVLVDNPLDVEQVRDKMRGIANMFEDPTFFFENEDACELIAAEHLVLLATLLQEHLRAGNIT